MLLFSSLKFYGGGKTTILKQEQQVPEMLITLPDTYEKILNGNNSIIKDKLTNLKESIKNNDAVYKEFLNQCDIDESTLKSELQTKKYMRFKYKNHINNMVNDFKNTITKFQNSKLVQEQAKIYKQKCDTALSEYNDSIIKEKNKIDKELLTLLYLRKCMLEDYELVAKQLSQDDQSRAYTDFNKIRCPGFKNLLLTNSTSLINFIGFNSEGQCLLDKNCCIERGNINSSSLENWNGFGPDGFFKIMLMEAIYPYKDKIFKINDKENWTLYTDKLLIDREITRVDFEQKLAHKPFIYPEIFNSEDYKIILEFNENFKSSHFLKTMYNTVNYIFNSCDIDFTEIDIKYDLKNNSMNTYPNIKKYKLQRPFTLIDVDLNSMSKFRKYKQLYKEKIIDQLRFALSKHDGNTLIKDNWYNINKRVFNKDMLFDQLKNFIANFCARYGDNDYKTKPSLLQKITANRKTIYKKMRYYDYIADTELLPDKLPQNVKQGFYISISNGNECKFVNPGDKIQLKDLIEGNEDVFYNNFMTEEECNKAIETYKNKYRDLTFEINNTNKNLDYWVNNDSMSINFDNKKNILNIHIKFKENIAGHIVPKVKTPDSVIMC